jgi:hypothetical protein
MCCGNSDSAFCAIILSRGAAVFIPLSSTIIIIPSEDGIVTVTVTEDALAAEFLK